MVLRRVEAREVGIVFEWDDEAGWTALGQLCRTREERADAYDRVSAACEWMDRRGIEWVDEELRESHRRVGMALVWRASYVRASDAGLVGRAVMDVLGVSQPGP